MTYSQALEPYYTAFLTHPSRVFLHYHYLDARDRRQVREITREAFWIQALRAATLMRKKGLRRGDKVLHCFGANHPADLFFRLASAMTGTVPATVNWQADGLEQVQYKIDLTGARLVLHDDWFDAELLEAIKKQNPSLQFFPVRLLPDQDTMASDDFEHELGEDDPKIVIFTSGTTGRPKGAQHSYRGYKANAQTFDSFLELSGANRFAAITVNPLHHANTTAISDWCLRHPAAQLHLIQRYSTTFWETLTEIVSRNYERVIVPATARHFDFLDNLDREKRLTVDRERLCSAMGKCQFLIGSAPVGPTTVKRLRHYAGGIPTVRFGSTETCLQVMGIPNSFDEDRKLAAFRRGWEHNGGEQAGYYIGREHHPYTEVRVVRSIEAGQPGYMENCEAGETGYLITAGANLMREYLANPQATWEVFEGPWYKGLKDVGFYLISPEDGERDFYWMSRESNLLIRGGANYSCEQIANHLGAELVKAGIVAAGSMELAVVGLKVKSEHEDSCCLTIHFKDGGTPELEQKITKHLRTIKPKGFRPDYLRFASIPHNFKGAVIVPELTSDFREWLKHG